MTGTLHRISTSRPRAARPLVEQAVALHVRDLRSPWGWLGRLELAGADGSTVKLSLNPDESCGIVWFKAEHWPAGARWSAVTYWLSLISYPQPFGGMVWRFACPAGCGRCSTLYLPAGADRLASRRAHGLAFASQSQRAPERAAAQAARIRAKLGRDGARPHGMHAATYAGRLALLARLDEASGSGL